jgi:hypothetical protein
MPIRPLAAFNVQSLDSVDDALAMLDANLSDLADMFKDQVMFGAKEQWVLDKNILFLKQYYDRLEALVGEESKS